MHWELYCWTTVMHYMGGLRLRLVQKLKMVQSVAARLLSGLPEQVCITPVPLELH